MTARRFAAVCPVLAGVEFDRSHPAAGTLVANSWRHLKKRTPSGAKVHPASAERARA